MKTQNTPLKTILPGFLLCLALSLAANMLAKWSLGLSPLLITLLLGIIVGNLFSKKTRNTSGLDLCEKWGLSLSIILLGLNLDLTKIYGIGLTKSFFIFGTVLAAVGLALVGAKLLKLSPKLGLLIGIGSGICGSSAIGSLASFITKDKKELGISLAVINLVGIAGLFFLPLIVHHLELNDTQAGLVIGGSLQSIAHVVASGFIMNEDTGEIATLIKMGRVALLAPLLVGFSLFQSRKQQGKVKLPNYLYGHLALLILANTLKLPAFILTMGDSLCKFALSLAMAAIGLRIHLGGLVQNSSKAILLGSLVFIAQITLLVALAHF